MRIAIVLPITLLGALALNATPAAAQLRPAEELPFPGRQPGPVLEDLSWTYQAPPPPEVIELHDIVTIRVDELARMQAEGELERRKNALYDAILNDWLRFDGLDSIEPSPQTGGDPRVQGTTTQLYRAEGDIETRESLAFNIAAEVVEIRPNGNLVLEAHKHIRINDEVWEYSLGGSCRPEDVGPGQIVLSRDILNLHIDKRERGSVYRGYSRGWLTRFIDLVQPF